MTHLRIKVLIKLLLLSCVASLPGVGVCDETPQAGMAPAKKLYWFIPDGMRADPQVFNIYKWAQEGKLPNIKRMMDKGTYGYCLPVYPGHTPVNFAALLTGAYPQVNGVSDGPMHASGYPLDKPAVSGFSSVAKTVEPIWVTLEKRGKTVLLLSIPGSTPPELKNGYTLVGRWGNWGASFSAINFEEPGSLVRAHQQGRDFKLFYFGPALTVFEKQQPCEPNPDMPRSFSPPREVPMKVWGTPMSAYIYDSTDDQKVNYDRIALSFDKKTVVTDLKRGEWSAWSPIRFSWKGMVIDTVFKLNVIKLDTDGFYRVRFLFNAVNWTLTEPGYVAEEMTRNIGPMVDSVDSFPAQLVFFDEDKQTFLEEAGMSFDWHADAVAYLLKKYHPDIFIHDIYTPNQMLTSRWWLGYIDPASGRYADISEAEREKLWAEAKSMYQRLDEIMGKYLAAADENTVVILTSDHGVVPLNEAVHLNNLFAREGWLYFNTDSHSGEQEIDWQKSMVVYLNFGNIYINPQGLHDKDGKWHRASGRGYEKLRQEVAAALGRLKNARGQCPVEKIVRAADAGKALNLPPGRVGDLVVANKSGFGWTEAFSDDRKIFSIPLETGYKQAVISRNSPGMTFPFMIMGPGIRKGHFLGEKPVQIIDQYPTVMKCLGVPLPHFVQGKALDVFDNAFTPVADDKR